MESDDLLCSRNARPQKDGKGSLAVLLLAEQRTGWSLMIFYARATRGRPSTQLGTLSLSKGGLPSLDARSRRSISLHP
jgi:hypothetical protein